MSTIPKNKIILLGNGFDLSHNLPTTFEDFVSFLLKEAIENTENISALFDHERISGLKYILQERKRLEKIDWNSLPKSKLAGLAKATYEYWQVKNPPFYLNGVDPPLYLKGVEKLYQEKRLLFPNLLFPDTSFLWDTLKETNEFSWLNFEKSYFKSLLSIAEEGNRKMTNGKLKSIRYLNEELSIIKSEFIRYLKGLSINGKLEIRQHLSYLLSGKIFPRQGEEIGVDDQQVEKQLILNFNYTQIPELVYRIQERPSRTNIHTINIHGDLENHAVKNPIIFGYGDEMDDNYHYLESLEEDEVLKHFKGTQYSKTHNYHEMLNFIELGPYQVDIIGHGCGMTDRVLLNAIFEHPYCDRIKILHYKDVDHYTETFMHVSRHFSRDKKGLLRERVLPFDPETPCPQWNDK